MFGSRVAREERRALPEEGRAPLAQILANHLGQEIAGTPTVAGTAFFTVQVADGAGHVASQGLSIYVVGKSVV